MSQADFNSRSSIEYHWKPLDQRKNEFRILELIGFTKKPAHLQAKLFHAPINTRLSYTALSYCWGLWPRDVPLILDNSQIMITRNLYEALSVLFWDGVRHVWVDALCIDQQNADEKGSQVLRMATIFKQAAEIAIWLGPEEPYSKKIMKALEEAAEGERTGPFWIQRFIKSSPHVNNETVWIDEFVDFLHRDYWRRLWVVQEIAVAAAIRIFWGRTYINGSVCESLFDKNLWEPVFYATPWQRHHPGQNWLTHIENEFPDLPWTSFRQFNYLLHLWDIRRRRRSRTPMSLLELLYEVCESEASERLDRVYAILGVAFDHSYFISEPDYGLSEQDLCLNMTANFIRSTGSLDIIFFRSMDPAGFLVDSARSLTEIASYPSWCMPFLNLQGASQLGERLRGHLQYLDGRAARWRNGSFLNVWATTCGSDALISSLHVHEKKLEVIGLKLGTVRTSYSSETWRPSEAVVPLQIVDAVCRLLLIHSPLYNEPEMSRQLLKRHCCSNSPSFAKEPLPTMEHSLLDLLEDVAADLESKDDNDECFAEAVKMVNIGRRAKFISIGIDCFGLMGDFGGSDGFEVWLLRGCSMPVVLQRKRSTSGLSDLPQFWLSDSVIIDTAIVCGVRRSVMDGEAWRTAPKRPSNGSILYENCCKVFMESGKLKINNLRLTTTF